MPSYPEPGVLVGLGKLARFRASGFADFTATTLGFLNSLAPLLAILMVGAGLTLLAGHLRALVVSVLSMVIALAAPAVLSHAVARRWGSEARWLRFIVAHNWCEGMITLLVWPLAFVVATAAAPGVPPAAPAVIASMVALSLVIYWIGLSWFLLWRGLGLSKAQAVGALLLVKFGTILLVIGPRLLLGGVMAP